MSESQIAIAFRVYKEGLSDDEGMTLLAAVEVGILDGPLAGLNITGIKIKAHKARGMRVTYPENVECFVAKEHGGIDTVSHRIIDGFAASYLAVTRLKREKDLSDFPEPDSRLMN